MPFLDSQLVRPLFDIKDGGPARGYECKLTHTDGTYCRRVTRTLAGMHSHQRVVHGVTPQTKLQFDAIIPVQENTK